MNLIRKLDGVRRHFKEKTLREDNKCVKLGTRKIDTEVDVIHQAIDKTNVSLLEYKNKILNSFRLILIKNNEMLENVKEKDSRCDKMQIDTFKTRIHSNLSLLSNICTTHALKTQLSREQRKRQFNKSISHAFNEISTVLLNNLESLLVKINKINKQNSLRTNDTTTEEQGKINYHKEKIHGSLRLVLNKILKDTENLLENTQSPSKQPFNRADFLKCNILKILFYLKSHTLSLEEKFKDSVTESFIFVLCKGSLENDKRFVCKVEQTLKDIEKFSDPKVVRMGIQFILALKYIKDIIFLKERALSKKYISQT